jgi:hypothetical protein
MNALRVVMLLCLVRAAPVEAVPADPPCPTMLVTATAIQASTRTRDVVSPDGRLVHVSREPVLTPTSRTPVSVLRKARWCLTLV